MAEYFIIYVNNKYWALLSANKSKSKGFLKACNFVLMFNNQTKQIQFLTYWKHSCALVPGLSQCNLGDVGTLGNIGNK